MSDVDEQVRQLRQRVDELEGRNGFLSPKLLVRAFTVWWHVIVAQVAFTILAVLALGGLSVLAGLFSIGQGG